MTQRERRSEIFVKITLASGEAAKVIQHRKRCRFYCASLVVPIDTVNGSNAHPLHVRYNGDDRSVSDDRVSDMDSPGSKSLSRSSRSPLSPQPMPSPQVFLTNSFILWCVRS